MSVAGDAPLFDPNAAPPTAPLGARPKSPPWLWIGIGASLVVGLLLAGGLWLGGAFGPRKIVKREGPPRPPARQGPPPLRNPEKMFERNPDEVKAHAVRPHPAADAPEEELIAYFDNGVVKIDVVDLIGRRKSLGTGFVIDSAGLVATNYHVVAEAEAAHVVFRDGSRYAVLGVRAYDPAFDLAILELNGRPDNIQPLSLAIAEPLEVGRPVLAIGHPEGHEFTTTRGTIQAIRETRSFPEATRRFLERFPDDFPWIQHDAEIASGNSGGPILSRHCDVLGVNTWLDTKTKANFALPVSYLAQLRERLEPTATPLPEVRRHELARRRASGAPDELALSVEKIRDLRSSLAAQGWNPSDAEVYQRMQMLALLTVAGAEDSAFDDETQVTAAALQSNEWDAETQIPSVNEFAERALAGDAAVQDNVVFLVAAVNDLPQSDESGGEFCWATLLGHDQPIQLRTRKRHAFDELHVGDAVVVLGVVVERLRLGRGQPQTEAVPVVLAGAIVPIQPSRVE